MKTLSTIFALGLMSLPAVAQPRFSGFVGGGPAVSLNPIGTRLDNGWNISAGAGIRDRQFGLMLDFMFNEYPINRTTLNQVGAPDGTMRVWGFTLDPVIHLSPRPEGPADFYITGGGGIYHRTVEFTQPAITTVTAFDPWFGVFFPADVLTNQVIGSYGVYKPGVNGGAGVSFKIGSGGVKVFAEARFHHIFTRQTDTNLLPLTFGIRW